MKLSTQTSNILNSVKWQMLKSDTSSAKSICNYIKQTYNNPAQVTQATINLYNSMHAIENNPRARVRDLCEWVEVNKGYRIKNRKDFEYIVYTIALHA